MGLKVETAPPVEPVDINEIKDHLRITNTEEEDYLETLIHTAREVCERRSNRAYIEQTLIKTFDQWPEFPIELPRPPVQSIEKIEYKDKDGDLTEWDSSNYVLDDYSFIPKIYKEHNVELPSVELSSANAIQITYIAGYAKDDSGDTTNYRKNVPARYKHAIKLLVGEWYRMREEIIGSGAVPQSIPDGVSKLLGSDRVIPI